MKPKKTPTVRYYAMSPFKRFSIKHSFIYKDDGKTIQVKMGRNIHFPWKNSIYKSIDEIKGKNLYMRELSEKEIFLLFV